MQLPKAIFVVDFFARQPQQKKCLWCVFFTFTRDVYARDEFEAKRERKKRVNIRTHARATKENIPSKITVTNRRVFGYIEKKRNNVYERERERDDDDE